MRRNSISVWRRARNNVIGLPECPDDLTEPQYAELVYGKTCFVSVFFTRRIKFGPLLLTVSLAVSQGRQTSRILCSSPKLHKLRV